MRRRTKWLIGIGIAAVAVTASTFIAGMLLVRRFEPDLRREALAYLSDRFDSDVTLGALHVRMTSKSPWRALFRKGRGMMAHVEGDDVSLRRRNSPSDLPPLITIGRFTFDVDLGTLLHGQKKIQAVSLDDMEINIPPKGERPKISASKAGGGGSPQPSSAVVFERVAIRNAQLAILSKHRDKPPLRFAIHKLQLQSAGIGTNMKYDAVLTNAKPPGEIRSAGFFGPWNRDEPGDTPLSGDYDFKHADLGVFSGIAGILHSTGNFSGTLDSINAKGEATVPDFRLKSSGNPVPLNTHFEVLVDGTNGDTYLKPVIARLGSTRFTTSGAVLKKEGKPARLVRLDVTMPRGNLQDLLRLAMKGSPFMEGGISLKTKIDIPAVAGDVSDKLRLEGQFLVSDGKFLRSTIQDQIDKLSRKGQGEPKNEEIDSVVSRMFGVFHLENQVMNLSTFSFAVPGAIVHLAGDYNLDQDVLDFHGNLKLQATVSQTMTGWRRWALKPVDPFFEKNGAGTFLKIVVNGTARKPHFGLDRGHKSEKTSIEALR